MTNKPASSHLQTEEETLSPRPPVMRRSATFFASISEKNYEKGYEIWNQYVNQELPNQHAEPRWRFELAGYENGLPKLKDTSPAMWMDSWHEKQHGEGGGSDEVRVFAGEKDGYGGITFSVVRDSLRHPRSFQQLKHFYTNHLTRFQEIFDITDFQGVDLEYLNLVDTKLFPEFKSSNGGINLAKVLSIHEQLTMPGRGYILPYAHKMTFSAHDEKPMQARVSVEARIPEGSEGDSKQVKMQVEIASRSLRVDEKSPFFNEKALQEMDECHEVILDFFAATFTGEARKLFDGTTSECDTTTEHAS